MSVLPPLTDEDVEQWRLWREVALRPALQEDIAKIYREIDREIATRSPQCEASGRCCRFNTYGHLLYVTGIEIACFLRQNELDAECEGPLDAPRPSGQKNEVSLKVLGQAEQSIDEDGKLVDGCAFQTEQGLCGAHKIRPLGCRVYYCDSEHQGWQNELYERGLSELKTLHERYEIPYRYMEWRVGLLEASRCFKLQ